MWKAARRVAAMTDRLELLRTIAVGLCVAVLGALVLSEVGRFSTATRDVLQHTGTVMAIEKVHPFRAPSYIAVHVRLDDGRTIKLINPSPQPSQGQSVAIAERIHNFGLPAFNFVAGPAAK